MRPKDVLYPYEYMDGWEKFEDTKVPPKNSFNSKLNMKDFIDQVYEGAEQVHVTYMEL